jgi:hypothetical protein
LDVPKGGQRKDSGNCHVYAAASYIASSHWNDSILCTVDTVLEREMIKRVEQHTGGIEQNTATKAA